MPIENERRVTDAILIIHSTRHLGSRRNYRQDMLKGQETYYFELSAPGADVRITPIQDATAGYPFSDPRYREAAQNTVMMAVRVGSRLVTEISNHLDGRYIRFFTF